jgi:CheY-like chemotaxis protein
VASQGSPEPIRILCMEDDAGLARLFQRKLERAGYQVAVAHDGREGLEMAETQVYDVVVMDHSMPVYDGLQVIGILAQRGTLPPTIMVTGTGNERIAVEALKAGASDYLVKDVDGGYLELLPTVIDKVLQQHRLSEEKKRIEAERERLIIELQESLAHIKTLNGLLPICASCKKIRDDRGYWEAVEVYISDHSEAEFTHGICPDCARKLYAEYFGDEDGLEVGQGDSPAQATG